MNIFENAYFGKIYKTRGDKKAIYLRGSFKHHLYLETGGVLDCNQDGTYEGILGRMENLDIISEYNPEVDEEELDKLAKELYPDDNPIINLVMKEMQNAYKAGYRKALNIFAKIT